MMNETMGMVTFRQGVSADSFGFSCTVPAVMATRALGERARPAADHPHAPFLGPAPPRLLIYVLFAEMFSPRHALLVAYPVSDGLVMAILVAFILHKNSRGPGRRTRCLSSSRSTRRPTADRGHLCVGIR